MFGWNRSFLNRFGFHYLNGDVTHAVEDFPLPLNVVIPLKQGFGDSVFPLVKEGDTVQAGQIIGAGEQAGSPVHATLNGKVSAIKETVSRFGEKVQAVFIEGDETPDFLTLSRFSPRFYKKKPEEIRNLIYRSGVSALGNKGIPTRFKSSGLKPEQVEGVFITAVNFSPFASQCDYLIKSRLHQFITGLKIIHFAMDKAPVYILIHKEDEEIVDYLKTFSKEHKWLKVYPIRPKYPIQLENLIQEAAAKLVSRSKTGSLCEHSVQLIPSDVLHIYEAVIEGRPLIDRFVSFWGNGFVKKSILRVRIGTSAKELICSQAKLERHLQISLGGALGESQFLEDDFPVDKSLSYVQALAEFQAEPNGSGFPGFLAHLFHSK